MAQTKIFTPTNLIIVGIAIIILANFGVFDKSLLAAVNLINSSTNQSYSCTSTYECYQKVSSQIIGTDNGPALSCLNNQCKIQTCVEGEEIIKDCQGGGKITVSQCVNGKIEYPNNQCPLPECTSNKNCISTADMDCDGNLDPVFGNCVSSKCQYTPAPRCSNYEIFWNQYKWYIISGALVLLGIGAFIFASPKINILR